VNPATADRRSGGHPAAVPHGHAAALVASDDDVLAVAVPFLEDGLRAGDLVALNCRPEHAELIGAAMGERLQGVGNDPRLSLLGNRAPDALAACERYLADSVGSRNGRLRILSSIDFGDDPADWREGQRFESVANRFLGPAVSVVCVYDQRVLPAAVFAGAAATHPVLVSGTTRAASAQFQEPDVLVPALPRPRASVEDAPPLLVVDAAPTLRSLRHALGEVLERVVDDADQREDLHLGASEIAANAFRHGVPPVSARVWADDRTVVVSISDRGSFDDPFSGFVPAHGTDLGRGGMGLWLARKLFDHVDLLHGHDGLTVRLSTRLR
jgi:anti-sigma regulatory factor (Ser/Thr protein kinase)